jgi:hypothetical protein
MYAGHLCCSGPPDYGAGLLRGPCTSGSGGQGRGTQKASDREDGQRTAAGAGAKDPLQQQQQQQQPQHSEGPGNAADDWVQVSALSLMQCRTV